MDESTRAAELARLVAAQAADDARRAIPEARAGGARVIREADLAARGRPRADLARVELDPHRDPGRRASKFRGRSRRVAVRDDAGAWVDTSASGARVQFWVLLAGCTPWEGAVQAAVMAGSCTCPVCSDAIRSPGHYCTYCDRSGLDGKVELHGIEVNTVLNPIAEQYEAEAAVERRKARERQQRGRTVRGGVGR